MAVWENNRKFAIGKQRLGIMIETNDRILPALTSEAEQQWWCGCCYGTDKSQAVCRAIQGW